MSLFTNDFFAKTLLYIHISGGGISLISGLVALILPKGKKFHILSGKIFAVTLTISTLSSLAITLIPGHENVFLMLIGLFTLYMTATGVRALRVINKTNLSAQKIDWTISISMAAFSMVMLALGIYNFLNDKSIYLLFLFFGFVSLMLSTADIRLYRKVEKQKIDFLRQHIARICGAYIASVTAFIVAGMHFSSLFYWISPTIIGTLYIIFWMRKLSKPEKSIV